MSKPPELNVADIADRYANAWKSHDPAAILALHAHGSIYKAHGRTGEVEGHDALFEEFSNAFARYPGFDVEPHRLLVGDRHWTLDWTLTFQSAAGDRRRIRAVDIIEIDDDGLVTRKDTFLDPAHVKAALETA